MESNMMASLYAIAQVFGPFLAVIGVWSFVFAKGISKVWANVKTTACTLYLAGLMQLLLGIFIVRNYNVWELHMGVFITLFGWFLLIRGLLILFFPDFEHKLIMKNEGSVRLWGIIAFIWGLLICKVGYMIAA